MPRPLALLLALAASSVALAQPRVSPRVRLAADGVIAARDLSDDGTDRALVTVDVDGGAPALRALGFDAQAAGPGLAVVRADRAGLGRLQAAPGVRTVEERRLLYPLLDRSAAATGAPAARLEAGVDGAGVLVAVIDSGIDYHHADFRTADGHSRVAALLDLALPADGRHPEYGELPGALFLRDEIDAQLDAEAAGMTPAVPVPSTDTNGHGTHVAGIAAGNGLATSAGLPSGRYVGLAPSAELVIVQARNAAGGFTDGAVMTGAAFVAAFAERAGRPLVLNLSLGTSGGPHDGTSNLERALDRLFYGPPGRAVCVAAGNDGTRDLHAHAFTVDDEVILPIEAGKSASGGSQITIDFWAAGPVTLQVETPKGTRFKPVPPGGVFDNPTSEARVIIDNRGLQPDNGRVQSTVVLAGDGGNAPASGTWRLHVGGPAGMIDAWIVDSPPDAPPAHFTDHVSPDDRLSTPATANGALTSGAFATRNSWTTHDGRTITRDRTTVGGLSVFSSSGPTEDGRFAPDVIAPGEYIASTLSRDTDPANAESAFFVSNDPGYVIADDGLHALLRGTSQAAPHLTGALALLFAVDPHLTAARAREVLRVTATPPSTGAAWTPREGFGRLDVLGAVRYLRGARGGAVDAARSAIAVSRDALPPGGAATVVTVIARDRAGLPLGPGHAIALATTAGEWAGPAVDLGEGRVERTLVARAPRGAVATVSATVDGVPLAGTATVWFVRDRSEIGQPFVAGGGCRTLPGGGARLPVALVVLVFFAVLRARRTLRG